MSRSKESKRYQIELQKKYGNFTEDRRQIMIIGMLSDIADSLATLCDLYASVHHYSLPAMKMEDDDADRS